jgi:hypothetical protein
VDKSLLYGHLTTSTDKHQSELGKYNVNITKDGYNDWQKRCCNRKGVVTTADALLFPKAPTLQSISTFGVESVVPDPSESGCL